MGTWLPAMSRPAMADFFTPDDAPVEAPAQDAAESPAVTAAPEPAPEGVLDELESWLTTLQNRSTH